MRRRALLLASLLSLVALVPARAQSVKGVVVDDSTKLAVEGARIVLVDGNGEEMRTGRSDSSGAFMIHATRPGTYRVRASRIGYQPLTSDPVKLGIGQIAVMRLRMTTLAQQLVPVRIVERRTMSAAELMSNTGYDLRESKGLGHFLSGERLAALGDEGLREVLASEFNPALTIFADSSTFGLLRIRQGLSSCVPEIFLDGQLLATTPEPPAILDTAGMTTAMDTLRLIMRRDVDNARLAAGQEYAMSVLTNLRASDVHGIEVYRANELPAPSLGAWFGMTRRSVRPCGTVAVWTKAHGRNPALPRNERASGVQVISGVVMSHDTGEPVPNVPVTLLSAARDMLAEPVRSNGRGEFSIRTGHAGDVRLRAGSLGYREATTPAFRVASDEVVIVKLFISARESLLAPLGVAARILPQTFGITSVGGFAYRRERGIGGAFFRREEIEASHASSIADLVRSLAGVRIAGAAAADTITFLRGEDLPRCRPFYYVDGVPVTTNVEATIGAIRMDRVFGVEVYTTASSVPAIFADAEAECGMIAVWMKP